MANLSFWCLTLCGASMLAFGASGQFALAQTAAPTSSRVAAEQTSSNPSANSAVAEVVVTAQKRVENINKVGMSIQAVSGQSLIQLGITDTAQLSRVVTGFTFTPSFSGTPIYTIRGVGFQENSLAATPTVSIYRDEVPIPFAIESAGSTLDLQRVEVLKGPQGTLFGENATGGAVNYIAAKPTGVQSEGVNVSYGRFNRIDAEVYVSGPITDTLDYRVAGKVTNSDGWQKSYTRDDTSGAVQFYELRPSLLWKPTTRLTALLTLEGWIDRSDSQQAQLYGINTFKNKTPIDPRILAYPLAPHNAQAADWSACVNTSPYDQPFNLIPKPYGYVPARPIAPTNCTDYEQNKTYYSGSLRLDYDLGRDMVLTSLTSYQRFNRYTPIDMDGTYYQDFEEVLGGRVSTVYQELRLAGKINGKGSWILGANFENDDTYDSYLNSVGDSTTSVTAGVLIPVVRPSDSQQSKTYAAFGDASYPLFSNLTAHGGIRFTETDKKYYGCLYDSGDGQLSQAIFLIQRSVEKASGYPATGAVLVPPGGCNTLSSTPPTFNPVPGGYREILDENNVSWRVGLDYTAAPGTLLYVNVSQGYKAGSFPTVAAVTQAQLVAAKQEGLLAYEGGFKSRLLEGSLQLNGAVFYYDYKNKQILGSTPTLVGALPILINIPTSHVIGGELSATWRPVRGLTITPAVSYAYSKIDGDFTNYTAFSELANFNGQPFPQAPRLTATIDAQYSWTLRDGLEAYLGADANYRDGTRQSLVNLTSAIVQPSLLDIPQRTLVDLRAGLNRGSWTVQLWARNVTDKYYWTNTRAIGDVLVRYAGMPATFGVTVTWRH